MDLLIAIRSNFFYTRAVPCELWFLNRNKAKVHKDKVLMLDARNVYRKVTRKIYDFSPEQQQNLQAIVWLYRGETERYLQLVSQYLGNVADEAIACFEVEDDLVRTFHPLPDFSAALKALREMLTPFIKESSPLPQGEGQGEGGVPELVKELDQETHQFQQDVDQFRKSADKATKDWEQTPDTNAALVKLTATFEPLAEASRDLIKQTDLIYKLATRLIDALDRKRSATSGNRPTGSPTGSRKADCATSKDWSNWWM